LKILALTSDPRSTITEIRLRTPLEALVQRRGGALRLRALHAATSADLLWAELLIVQRGLGRRALAFERRMTALGGRVIYEIDDLLVDPAPHLEHAGAMRAQREQVLACLRAADAVSASTEPLAQALRPLARDVRVLPNYAPPAPRPRVAAPDAAAPLTLLLASSDQVALELVLPALLRVLAAGNGRVQIVAVGACAAQLAAHGVDVRGLPLLPHAEFLAFVASLPNPVGVIPLDDSRFSACKSAVKYYDYAALGVPTLCSRVLPYSAAVDDGRTGLLVDNTADAWFTALQRVLDEPGLRMALADAAMVEVDTKHSLAQTVDAWGRLLDSLPRRALTPAVRRRRWLARWRAAPEALLSALRSANRARQAQRARR